MKNLETVINRYYTRNENNEVTSYVLKAIYGNTKKSYQVVITNDKLEATNYNYSTRQRAKARIDRELNKAVSNNQQLLKIEK